MGGFSDAVENDVLDHMLGVAQWSYSATQRTMSLHTGDPGEDGSANEVTGGSYSRQDVTFSVAANGISSNTNKVEFTLLPACTVTHAGVWDGASLVCAGALNSSVDVSAGSKIYFNPGDVDVNAD